MELARGASANGTLEHSGSAVEREGPGEVQAARNGAEESPAVLAMLWFGFGLVHLACFSLIGIAASANFYAGFAADIIYFFFLVLLAGAINRTHRFHVLNSLVWILACCSIFTIGAMVAKMIEDHYGSPSLKGYGSGHIFTLLLCAIIPMMTVAIVVLCSSGVMGTFLNVYYGILYTGLLFHELPAKRFPGLLKVFFRNLDVALTYFAVTYLLVAVVSLFFTLKGRLQDLRPWVAACSLVPLWLLLHDMIGGFPALVHTPGYEQGFTVAFKAFLWYAGLAVVQIGLALIVDEFVPMVLAGISLFIVAIQGSHMVGQAVYTAVADPPNPVDDAEKLAEVAQLATMALLGAVVLFISVLFALRRARIDEVVRAGKTKLRQKVIGTEQHQDTSPADRA